MKKETIHHSRFLNGDVARCGIKLNDGVGTINLHSHTINSRDVTCKRCIRTIKSIKI